MPSEAARDLYVFDLGMISRDGTVPYEAMVRVPTSVLGRDVYAPRYVAAGNEVGEFLVTSENSYNHGLTLLKVGVDNSGHLDAAKTTVTTVTIQPTDSESSCC